MAAALSPKSAIPAGDSTSPVTIPQGQRNDTLTRMAGAMRRQGMDESAIVVALLETNTARCAPPLPENEVKGIAASVVRYPTGPVTPPIYVTRGGEGYIQSDNAISSVDCLKVGQKSDNISDMAGRVREWVSHTSGWFFTDELDKELGFATLPEKDYRGKILRRLKDEGVVQQHLKMNRQWRCVNRAVTKIDFKSVTSAKPLPVKWPLGIEKYVNLYPGNMAVVAGAPESGKSALLLNFIKINMEHFPIYYFCSENTGQDELSVRLGLFPDMKVEYWRFEAIERSSDFEDVIVPDCVNIVDYLEITEDLYLVNTHLTNISHKIGTGLAIVALQKKIGARLGRSQEFGLEKPRLYLSMDEGKLTIVKGKAWANLNVNPHGLSVYFRIARGCQFEITRDWGNT